MTPFLHDLKEHITLPLEKPLFGLVHMIVRASIGSPHGHDDKVALLNEIVVHGRLKLMGIVFGPFGKVDGGRERGHMVLEARNTVKRGKECGKGEGKGSEGTIGGDFFFLAYAYKPSTSSLPYTSKRAGLKTPWKSVGSGEGSGGDSQGAHFAPCSPFTL